MELLFSGDVVGAFAVCSSRRSFCFRVTEEILYVQKELCTAQTDRCSICVLGGIAEDLASKKQILQRKLHFLVAVGL